MVSTIPLHEFDQPREFSRPDSLSAPFEIARIDNLSEGARPSDPHRHTYYEIFWFLDGGGTHYVDFEGYPISPNTFFFITPGQIHYPEITKPPSGYVLLFTEDFLSLNRIEHGFLRGFDFFHRIDHTPTLQLTDGQAQPFNLMCEQMDKEYNGDAFGRLVVLQSLLQSFLVQIQRLYGVGVANESRSEDSLVQQFVRMIDLHFLDKHEVRDYAGLLGVTAGHLTDSTREALGISASQLIHQRLIVEAKRLFAHSGQTVAQVSEQLNFADPSYFARFFKRETSLSPSQFKEQYREKHLLHRNS